jgi:hypothetical protein
MTQRGRKSAAELATISGAGIATTRRLSPPPDLTEEQSDVWRSIVNGNPADLFNAGSAPVLAALCRHVVAGSPGGGLDSRGSRHEDGLDEEAWFRLLARQEAESKMVARLATRLRLTPAEPLHAARCGRCGAETPRRPRRGDVRPALSRPLMCDRVRAHTARPPLCRHPRAWITARTPLACGPCWPYAMRRP